MIVKAFAMALATLAVARTATADPCNATLTQTSAAPSITYDPFDGTPGDTTLNVEIVNASDEPCTVALAVGQVSGGAERLFTNVAAKLRYLVKQQGAELANDLSSPSGLAVVDGGVGKRQTLSFSIEVPAGQIAPAGTYTDVVQLRAFDLTGGRRSQLGPDRAIQATVVVQPRAQVNIAGASGAFAGRFGVGRIDFGQMEDGAERNAFVQVRATSPVTITLSSQNRGRLLQKVLRDQVLGVPYTLRLDGTPIDLVSGSSSLTRTPPIALEGASYPLSIRLGDVTGRRAGEFQDLITIDVTPQ